MATEGPLLHDGSQNTAAVTLTQFYACKLLAGTSREVTPITVGGERIYGIVQNKPLTGQAADVGFMGISKAVAKAVISSGHTLAVATNGTLKSCSASTSTQHIIGYAIESAVTNQVFTMMIMPGAAYLTSGGN